ncbi:MAG TPA: SDR family oxidoreductase [Solirubrobacteraceae bacterium]|jgi:3-oxoacyl-[acyl-carrier protein] reductase|nr:SDR family oxidoreductase [Solirubrobacteraceae bacterium]
MDLGLKGKIALVTGASKGLGRATAEALIAEGARVAVSSRSRERIDATAQAIGAVGVVHDSGDLDHAAALIDAVEEALGPLDVLVVNTGGPPVNPDSLGHEREVWEATYREHVLAPLALVERALPGMRERGFGRVLNVSSTSTVEPIPGLVLSSAHRAALLTTFKTLAAEVAADGVTLNTLMPGRFGTDRLYATIGGRENAEAAAADIPARRLGRPEEFAAAAAFLCSTRAAYISGTALRVDGGLTRSA